MIPPANCSLSQLSIELPVTMVFFYDNERASPCGEDAAAQPGGLVVSDCRVADVYEGGIRGDDTAANPGLRLVAADRAVRDVDSAP